jgi:hypothetical protein
MVKAMTSRTHPSTGKSCIPVEAEKPKKVKRLSHEVLLCTAWQCYNMAMGPMWR